MFTNLLRERIIRLQSIMREKRRQHDRNHDHLRALIAEGGISMINHLLDTFFNAPSLDTLLEERIELLIRSRDNHMEQCALPDDCTIALDYDARIEELQWLMEVLDGSATEIPVPTTCDKSDSIKHL